MRPVYQLPRLGSPDIVGRIQQRRENAKRKRTRCFGTNSCDCPRCR